jgi:glycosyltransferase involved in cell wall biosynthesis
MISIVVPAFNERSVIARTLKTMTSGADPGELDVIVVCNGCTDDTATIARSFGQPVRVIETELPSKPRALNLGDQAAKTFPRLYTDADVTITIDMIRKLAQRLERGDVLAVAPTPQIDLAGCSWSVRACFDIKSRLPSAQEGIGGSGVYALSETGRRRFLEFPMVTSDDGYVRIQFTPEERETLTSASSTVFAPATIKDLIAYKTRAHYGSFELAELFPELWENRGESNALALGALFRCPWLWHKLFVYSCIAILARCRAKLQLRRKTFTWQRDEASRGAAKRDSV